MKLKKADLLVMLAKERANYETKMIKALTQRLGENEETQLSSLARAKRDVAACEKRLEQLRNKTVSKKDINFERFDRSEAIINALTGETVNLTQSQITQLLNVGVVNNDRIRY